MSRGDNNKKSVATIEPETFKVEIFDSLSDCSKKMKTSIKAISKVANDKKFYLHKNKTIVFYFNDEQLKKDILTFKEKRRIIDDRKDFLPKTRICDSCNKELPLTTKYFHRGRKSIYKKETFKRTCKECRKKQHFIYYKNKREKRETNFDEKVKYVFNIYKKLDKDKKGFNLTIEWIKENLLKPCIYCGFESKGFDRKNNSIGHTIDNCVPCCTECNNARMNNFTHEEFFIIGDAIRQIKINRNKNES